MSAEVSEATIIGLAIFVGCVMLLAIFWRILPWLLRH